MVRKDRDTDTSLIMATPQEADELSFSCSDSRAHENTATVVSKQVNMTNAILQNKKKPVGFPDPARTRKSRRIRSF